MYTVVLILLVAVVLCVLQVDVGRGLAIHYFDY